MKISSLYCLYTLLIFSSCHTSQNEFSKAKETEGSWTGKIHSQGKEIPFGFSLKSSGDNTMEMTIFNGKEAIIIKDIRWKKDSLIIPMHIFDTEIRAVVESGSMKGHWIKNYTQNYQLPFTASKEKERFPTPEATPAARLSGKWAVTFEGRKTHKRSYNAIALLEQNDRHLSGTFLTPSGDYRYLEGVINKQQFTLSSFDGENAYLFEGEILHENTLAGTFWSGKSRTEAWTAERNENASLPKADSLTFLKEGYERISFEFPDLEGNLVSLDDPKYRNKVMIIQILGSWCPNCMDETRFLADWYARQDKQDVAIIGLAYEKKDDFEYANQRVQKMAKKLNAGYDFLIAGTPDKASTEKSLPMLNHIMAFPTTIFIDKSGKVRRIHTGFYGPGTGDYYNEFVDDFNSFTKKLMKE